MEIQVNNLTAPERLDLGRMLLKAGYTVQMCPSRFRGQ